MSEFHQTSSPMRRISLRPPTSEEMVNLLPEHIRSFYTRNIEKRIKSMLEDQQYAYQTAKNREKGRQATGAYPPIPYIPPRRISQHAVAAVETMASIPAVTSASEDERSTTDKFNLKLIPISVLLDYRIEKDGRKPQTINMCYHDIRRLLQENVLIQGCYRGYIPVIPIPHLPEGEIVINY